MNSKNYIILWKQKEKLEVSKLTFQAELH